MNDGRPRIVLVLVFVAGILHGSIGHAQVEITITGDPAFRFIVADRAASLYDAGSHTAVTNDAAAGLMTFSGTMSNRVVSLADITVTIRLSFSGSVAGMLAVLNRTPVPTAEAPGTNVNRVPDLTLSDMFPGAAIPPIAVTAFDLQSILGVVPFVFARNNALTGMDNITSDQAVLLMTASGLLGGFNGMPATYLGGTSTNPVYLIGSDSGSGTRVILHEEIRFHGKPTFWATNDAGDYVITNGY